MKQNQVILTYGKIDNIPEGFTPIDVTEYDWATKIPNIGKILCDKSAYVYAMKYLPSNRLANSPAEIFEENKKETTEVEEVIKATAATSENILVSAKYNKLEKDNKVWLSPHHINMIGRMLGAGCKITLLDEENNIVKELTWKK